jgi:hypothetical protein
VTSHATKGFWDSYERLPQHVKRQAKKAYLQFQDDPTHPSLHFKCVRPDKSIYSARVGIGYRALGVRVSADAIVWFWIGSHSDYDHLISQ